MVAQGFMFKSEQQAFQKKQQSSVRVPLNHGSGATGPIRGQLIGWEPQRESSPDASPAPASERADGEAP
jgi:hypothetical protein